MKKATAKADAAEKGAEKKTEKPEKVIARFPSSASPVVAWNKPLCRIVARYANQLCLQEAKPKTTTKKKEAAAAK